MPKFEKQYVHFMWSDELKGKEGFFADDIDSLINIVTNDCLEYWDKLSLYTSCNSSYPFTKVSVCERFRFFYYDPYYELKRAREQGKVIQRYWKSEQEWDEYIGDDFPDDISFYRIKPEEPEEEFEFETTKSLFEERYIHRVWSNELEGKKVFFADYEDDIRSIVENNNVNFYGTVVRPRGDGRFPFHMEDDAYYAFCYYDPYYDMKVALEQGKTIQGKNRLTGEWVDMAGKNIDWDNVEGYELRVKPDEPKESKPVTNRELTRWLAQGNGECKSSNSDMWFSTIHYYWSGEDNTPAKALVRKWEDTEWHKPTREYMGLE